MIIHFLVPCHKLILIFYLHNDEKLIIMNTDEEENDTLRYIPLPHNEKMKTVARKKEYRMPA